MSALRYTLITDGSSDRSLLNIIDWLLRDLYPELPTQPQFADFRNLRRPPKTDDVQARLDKAKELYPCDIIFYHRDAEMTRRNIIDDRKREVLDSINEKERDSIVCVVPVVMMETWLLIEVNAIKRAAGNRNYPGNLLLPNINRLEGVRNPKAELHHLLTQATNKSARNLRRFNVHEAVHLVSEYISDFNTLRQLPSFQTFERDTKKCVDIIINK